MRLALVLALFLVAPFAQAWVAGPDRPHHADLALAAVERLPPEMRSIIERDMDVFWRGALEPDGILDKDKDVHVFYHQYEPSDGTGGGAWRVHHSVVEAAGALREGNGPKAAYLLGYLTHFSTDLAMPLHTGKEAFMHPRHEAVEKEAYDHKAELALALPARAPREVADPEAYAVDLARQSASMWPELEESIEAWSPATAEVLSRAASLAVEASADLMFTAFAWADPARPAPPEPGPAPLPVETADVAWGPREIALASGGVILAAIVTAFVVRRARPL